MISKNIFIFLFSLFFITCTKEEPALTFAIGGAPNEVEYLETLVNRFEEKYNIKVKILRQPTDTDQRRQGLVIPLQAKKSNPDVFLMDVIWVGQFAASDWLLTIDPYIQRDSFDITHFFSNIIKQVDTYNDNVVALPVYNDCGLLYYRKDLLEQYNCSYPKTWRDLIQCAQKVQKEQQKRNPQFYGFIWQGAQYEGLVCTFLEFAASNHGDIIDENNLVIINREENIEALQLMIDLIHKYRISPPNTYTEMKEEEVRLTFENGNALFERNWPYAWGLHKRNESPLNRNFEITLLPAFTNGKHAATLGGWHIGISKYSDAKEKAWELVKFIVSYDTQKKLALDLSWNPGRSDIYNDPGVIEKMPQIAVLKKAFENSVARPNLPYYTQISEVLQRYLNAALSGELTSREALSNSQEEIEKVVKTYHE
jgi:multiple sugar transport system substrate-binding protein